MPIICNAYVSKNAECADLASVRREILAAARDAKENERHDFIAAHKKEIGYVNAVDQQMEELSDDEKKQLDEDK